MADSILRLKVESQEYDQKIKRASEGILKYAEDCRKAGGTLEYLDEGVEDFVKALGQMNTVSNSAKGKINEMTRAFTDLSLQYKNLTDEEKASPFGKALQGSLDQLKGRITDAKKDLADVNKELGDTGKEGQSAGSILDQLSSKFGISTKALTTWGVALGAGAAALKVAKDAFFASEQNLDDWNRMVYSSQSTYEAFLTSLNTGDVSGFLNNINTIVKAANDAYDAIDRLQTTQNIQAPQIAKKQAEIQRMETMLRTGRWVGAIDGRKSPLGLKDGDILTKAQKDRITKQLESAIMELAGLTRKEVVRANDAIDKLYNQQALHLGMSKQKFMAGLETIETFEANVNQGKEYQKWENNRKAAIQLAQAGHYDMMTAEQKNYINTTNPYEAYKGWSVFKDDGQQYQQVIQMIQNRTAKEQQYYSEIARAYRQINRVEGYKPYGGGKTEKDITGLKVQDFSSLDALSMTESKKLLQERLAAYQKMLNEATNMFVAGTAQKGIEDTQRLLDAQPLALKMGISAEAAAELKEQTESLRDWVQEDLNREVVRLGIQPKGGEKDKDKDDSGGDSDKFGDAIKTFQQVNSGIGQLTSGIQQLGIKLPEGLQRALSVMQGLASIASGISTLMSLFNASETASRTANTAAITTLTGAILANTAALEVNSISGFLPFARGGIVPHAANGYYVSGNNFSGDTTPILANAGELILNRAAQGNLASILQDRESEGVASQPYVSGEQIFLAVNNYLRRSGRGEIVTAR